MSYRLMQAALYLPNCKRTQQHILAVLADIANDKTVEESVTESGDVILTGQCYPSLDFLTTLTGYCLNTVRSSIAHLIKFGVLTKEQEDGKVNRYTLRIPAKVSTSTLSKIEPPQKLTPSKIDRVPCQNLIVTPSKIDREQSILTENINKAGIKDKSAPPSYMQFSATDFDAFLAWTTNYNVDSVLRTFWLEKGITDKSRQRSFLEKAFSRMGQSTCPNESGRVRFLKSVLRSNFEEFYNAIEADALKAPPTLTEEEEIRQIEEFRARIKAEHALANQPTPIT